MARLPLLRQTDLPLNDQPVLAGKPIDLVRALAHSPGATRGINALAVYLRRESGLDPRLREMAILLVACVTQSRYGFSHHAKIGMEAGVSVEDIRAVIAECAGRATNLDPLTKAVLRAAREMTEGVSVAPETFETLRRALDPEHLVDLLVNIAFYNSVVRLIGAFDLEIEHEYLRFLDEFPLPR